MKKIMIMLAAVAMTAASYAASIDWGVSAYPMFKGADGKTSLAAGSAAYLIVDWDTNQGAILAALAGGTLSTSTAGVIAQGVTANTMGGVATSTASSNALAYDKGVTTYDFAVLLVDKNTKEGETWYNVSQVSTKAAYDPSKLAEYEKQTASFAANSVFSAANSQSGGWQAVPEPTSGLLMLVGLAGLALRRKRA